MDENKLRQRLLTFGIRDLLWAMALVGMGAWWWAQQKHTALVEEKLADVEWTLRFVLRQYRSDAGRGMIVTTRRYGMEYSPFDPLPGEQQLKQHPFEEPVRRTSDQ